MKTEYDSIICVYSSCDHLASAFKICKSLKSTNYKIIIFLTKDCKKKCENKEFEIVHLDTPEGYHNLCLKTYKMIEYIHLNYKYKTIYKVDASIETGETCQKTPETKTKIIEKFFNNSYITKKDYDGAATRTANKNLIQKWANKKQIKVNVKHFNEITGSNKITYYSGKFYVLSFDFIRYMMERSNLKNLSSNFATSLLAEDLMIGVLHQHYLKEKKA